MEFIANLFDIHGQEKLDGGLHLTSYNFIIGVLRNEGSGQFEFIPFPNQAQISSINSFLTKDLDGDGLEDIILAGNLYTSEIESPTADAGYGLVLLKCWESNFDVLDAAESGLFLSGDIKTMSFIRNDKQLNLMACSNDGPISIYRIR